MLRDSNKLKPNVINWRRRHWNWIQNAQLCRKKSQG